MQPIPKTIAEKWLHELVLDSINDLVGIFPKFSRFSPRRKIALIDMHYNLGRNGFRSFVNMVAAVRDNDWDKAAKEALDSRWAGQVKGRALVDAEMLRSE